MDDALSDEILREILLRLPTQSNHVSIVSKRWLAVHRNSINSLYLHLRPHPHPPTLHAFSSLLSNLPCLSSLAISLSSQALSPSLFLAIADLCPNLRSLSFLPFPVSASSLNRLSRNCPHLSSLSISLSRQLSFRWLVFFTSIRELSVIARDDPSCDLDGDADEGSGRCHGNNEGDENEEVRELCLESLFLTAIKGDDSGLCWLWRRCSKLRRLALKSCEGIGVDGDREDGYFWFIRCLKGIKEVEIRICRSIVNEILSKLAEHCDKLVSLLLHDGGSSEALFRFLCNNRSNLESLDLRLPLDLSNVHILALSSHCGGLVSFKVQSCFLGTGDGLKALVSSTGSRLRELHLVHCDVVDRERGLLPALGQHLRQLTKLDLSCNEMLEDQCLISMLASCDRLIELGLRGCRSLTSNAVVGVSRRCTRIEYMDIVDCPMIDEKAVEFLLRNSPRLKQVLVEYYKVSDVARKTALRKSVEIMD